VFWSVKVTWVAYCARLNARSDQLKARNARRAKLRSIASQAQQRGDHAKAARVRCNNLGTVKKHRQEQQWRRQVRDVTYRAVHAVADRAGVIVAEDLTRPIRSTRRYGKNTNRRLAAWTKGVTAQALHDIGLHTPHTRVKRIIQERADRHPSRLPDQDSNTTGDCRCGERNIPTNDQS
jgi:hypothetical protein